MSQGHLLLLYVLLFILHNKYIYIWVPQSQQCCKLHSALFAHKNAYVYARDFVSAYIVYRSSIVGCHTLYSFSPVILSNDSKFESFDTQRITASG